MKSTTAQNPEGLVIDPGSGSVIDSVTFTVNPLPPPVTSLKYSIEVILNQHINRLKARMLNIAEAVCGTEIRQCNAVKGLMKDALNQAYYDSLREINSTLEVRGIEVDCGDAPISALRANSLDDILVD